MGYAIFANRKIMLTNQINMLQIELDQIMNQKQNLLNYAANIAAGYPSVDDFAQDFTNSNEYSAYARNVDAYIANNTSYTYGGTSSSTLGDLAIRAEEEFNANNSAYQAHVGSKLKYDSNGVATNYDDLMLAWQQTTDVDAYQDYLNYQQDLANYKANVVNNAQSSLAQEYYNNVESKRVAAIENELEMKQKRIETKLTALKQDLQACEQAEGQAIQMATPKYAGVG